MGIKQNFDKNMKKALKKAIPTLPPNSKFIFQQLLKNSHHIEENLEDETMVEYKIGDLRKVIKSLKEGKQLLNEAAACAAEGSGPGAENNPCGVGGDCSGRLQSVMETPDGGGFCICRASNGGTIQGGHDGGCIEDGQTVNMWVGNDYEKETGNVSRGIKNLGYGDSAISSIRHDGHDDSEVLSEKDSKYCGRKKGKCCDGGDGHKCGKYVDDEANKKCTCSYEGPCCSGSSGKVASKDIEKEMDEATTTASSGAYSTPKFWAKGKKNHRFATKRWMPDSKYVKVKDKCKKFPYCNQGDINALEIWEKSIMRESAKNVAKKTGKSESEVREMIENELAEVIRRSFYKSPIKDLVGTSKMKTPIGKIFTMSGNKPKYES